jgi:hypothetical protein
MASVLGLAEGGAYTTHPIHDDERTWPETNCYVDVWVGVLHSLGLDPLAGLAFTLGIDFEGDQYTFFKFSHADLWSLYGIEVQELNPWRSVAIHAAEQEALGRFLMPEVDSHFLPDTAGVSYKIDHAKSTIAIAHIDIERRILHYFHNRGYYTLSGDDFAGVFRLDGYAPVEGVLPPYVEIAKLDRIVKLSPDELVQRAVGLTRAHLARRPARNPISQHRDRLQRDLEWLKGEPLSTFHQYAFATVRQAGAGFGLTASYLRWLSANGEAGLEQAAEAFETLSTTAKTIQFKLARMANLKRDVDLTPLMESMERAWDDGMAQLVARYGD